MGKHAKAINSVDRTYGDHSENRIDRTIRKIATERPGRDPPQPTRSSSATVQEGLPQPRGRCGPKPVTLSGSVAAVGQALRTTNVPLPSRSAQLVTSVHALACVAADPDVPASVHRIHPCDQDVPLLQRSHMHAVEVLWDHTNLRTRSRSTQAIVFLAVPGWAAVRWTSMLAYL